MNVTPVPPQGALALVLPVAKVTLKRTIASMLLEMFLHVTRTAGRVRAQAAEEHEQPGVLQLTTPHAAAR